MKYKTNKNNKPIKSTKIYYTKHLNKNKQKQLNTYINEYQKTLQIVYNDYKHKINTNQINLQTLTKYQMDYTPYTNQTWLSARTIQTITDHAFVLIKSQIENKKLKPINCKTQNLRLYSNNIKFGINKNQKSILNEYLTIRCMGINNQFPKGTKIEVPIQYHTHYNELSNKSIKRMGEIEINKKYIKINFQMPKPEFKTKGETLGADQGISTTLTLSNITTTIETQQTDNHRHTLKTIINKISRRKKGSKRFKKAQEHRKNFINWSINQLNLTNIKQINLEKVHNLKRGKRRSKLSTHWTYPLIASKLFERCQSLGVLVVEQSSFYRSRRCSNCGMVNKKSRKGKQFSCISCGFNIDADINAARNHAINLPFISKDSLFGKHDGFLWFESGIVYPEEFPAPQTEMIVSYDSSLINMDCHN